MKRRALLLLTATLPLGGCLVAKVATTAVLLPVKVVGAGIDAVVTTQAEADEKRGREARKAEEKAARERRKAAQDAPPR